MTEKDEDEYMKSANDQEKNLAVNAYSEFKKKNYNTALQHIHKLEYRSYDFKVFLNKAVVEYYKSDFKKTEQFEKALTSLCDQFNIQFDKLDDVSHCIVLYNKVVLLFHKREYTLALRIIEKLYKFIEPMDDVLARKVCFLAAELQLLIKMPDKALSTLTYVEDHLIDKKQSASVDASKSSNTSADELCIKVAKYKARCYIMKRNLSIAKNQIQLFDGDQWKVDALFLNANQQYLGGQFQKALKTLSLIPQSILKYSKHGESSAVLFNNNMGVIHHALGKHHLACIHYQTALREDMKLQEILRLEPEKQLFTLGGSRYHELTYNLGISLLYCGRYSDAFDALIIAVRRYHRNSRLWLRIAECCIKLHKPSNEADFDFNKSQRKNCVNKIGQNKESMKYILTTNVSRDHKYSSEGQSYAVPVPTLEFASICLRNALILIPSESDSTPQPVYVKPGVRHPAPTPTLGPAPSSPLDADGNVELKNAILAASAFVSMCLGDYIVALEHAEALLAQPRVSSVHKLLAHLYAAECLILLNKITEAMEHLNPNNIKDLRSELPPEKKEAEGTPEEKDEVKTRPPSKWFPRDVETAKVIMMYNLAAAKAIRGQFDQANALMQQICGNQRALPDGKYPIHMIMLIIYIQLKLGHLDYAKNFIKQYVNPYNG
ncbi:CCR4-NOT transcription complex subunit 10 [Coccinella septempunctata]|uniref:CCR4-NOT transcription complex subunit 10 n=1 Tax=Coccinella septempunctata TaxID=41139 RepID=UPI001D06F940|nr:CCR4-NOT transcription complex subunit 10 [Coccinella septempunctata]